MSGPRNNTLDRHDKNIRYLQKHRYFIYILLLVYVLLTPLYLLWEVILTLFRFASYNQRIKDLKSRYVFITGCDSGFGLIVARKLHEIGVNVLATCLTDVGVKRLKSEGISHCYKLDITDKDAVSKTRDEVEQFLDNQGAELWALVNNAGIHGLIGETGWMQPADYDVVMKVYFSELWALVNNAGIHGLIGETGWMQPADYDVVMKVNFSGHVICTTAFLPLIQKSGGRIVTTSSFVANFPYIYCGPYAAAKSALTTFMRVLRRELAHTDVRVIMLTPGFFKTPGIGNATSESLTHSFSRLPKEKQEELGIKNFKWKAILTRYITLDGASGGEVPEVIDCYMHAILGKCPKENYWVGCDAQLTRYLLHFSEDFHRLHARFMKYISGEPSYPGESVTK